MARKPREAAPLTGTQVKEILELIHRHKPSATRAIVRGLHINRSTLSRWRRHRGTIPLDGLGARILARLHKRLVEASETDLHRFEVRVDWGLAHDDELAALCALLWIIGAPL